MIIDFLFLLQPVKFELVSNPETKEYQNENITTPLGRLKPLFPILFLPLPRLRPISFLIHIHFLFVHTTSLLPFVFSRLYTIHSFICSQSTIKSTHYRHPRFPNRQKWVTGSASAIFGVGTFAADQFAASIKLLWKKRSFLPLLELVLIVMGVGRYLDSHENETFML